MSDEPREIPFTGTFLNELRETAKPLAEWVGWDVDEILEMAALNAGPDATKEKLLVEAMKTAHEKFDRLAKDIESRVYQKEVVPADLDSHRHMKNANENLQEIVNIMNEMTPEQLEGFEARKKAAQDDPTITLGDELDSKDIYLRMPISDKITNIFQIVGLHAIGYAGPYEYEMHHQDGSIEKKTSNFNAIETWGNEYDDEHNMLGRGSFRLHTSDIEEYAKEMEAEGWVRYEGPKRKLPTDT